MKKLLFILIALLAALDMGASVSFRDLDNALKNEQYQITKEERISLKKNLAAAAAGSDGDLYFRRLSDIRDEYALFQIDSALAYSIRCASLAESLGRPDYLVTSQLHIAEGYIKQGMYVEARDLLEGIDENVVPDTLKTTRLGLFCSLFDALEENTENLDLKREYRNKACALKEVIHSLEPDNALNHAAYLIATQRDDEALGVLLARFSSIDFEAKEIGGLSFGISQCYRRKGMRQEEKEYLIISAISDIKHSLKEYVSLRRLSEILYEERDYYQAHRYILRCMDDAMFCGSRLRVVQISQILPILETTYQQKLFTRLVIVSVSGVIILILLVVLLVLLRQKHRQQIEIDRANKLLSEAGAIKNVYIFNLLMEAVNRIETLDKYRKGIRRKAIEGNWESLIKDLKSTTLVEDQWREFYQCFDHMFLEIFPSFIKDVNKLMTPDNQFEEGSMNVELRILALIRLGLEETERISAVLKYSKATVYSYRSRMRLRSSDPKRFEDNIKEIQSI